ncbi:MAG: DUF6351 family protein, partial [Steroidobacteraceae bacterium]
MLLVRRILLWGMIAGVSASLGGCAEWPTKRSGKPTIKVVSNRADLVSGDDALVEIVLPSGTDPQRLQVDVDGRDVTSAFTTRADSRILGLVTGLTAGPNIVTARVGRTGARLTVTNHPIGGPIFSGPQVQPWICATPTAQPATATSPATNASGLSTPASDAQCNIASEQRLFYRTTEQCSQTPRSGATPCFKPYDPQAAPADLAETTTDQGVTMKYIVRVERGVMNRA